MKFVWIVYKERCIYGMFHSEKKAITYIADLQRFRGIKDVINKKITLDEYKKICYDNIN